MVLMRRSSLEVVQLTAIVGQAFKVLSRLFRRRAQQPWPKNAANGRRFVVIVQYYYNINISVADGEKVCARETTAHTTTINWG